MKSNTQIAVITGDIIHSQSRPAAEWMPLLTDALNSFGTTPDKWEIYRGDSFQLEISEAHNALKASLIIKSLIKQNQTLDVRLAIGVGEKEFNADRLTQSNGSAFVRSGELFDQLKKNTLAIRSADEQLDQTINLMLSLAQLTINHWTVASAEIMELALSQPDSNQADWAQKLGIRQSTVSDRLKRAGFDEIQRLETYFRDRMQKIQS